MTKLLEEDQPLTKFNFAPLLKKVLDQTMKKATIVNGFRACGLFPYNPDTVDYTKKEITRKHCETTQNLDSICSRPNHCCLGFFVSFINKNTLEQFKETYIKFTPVWQGDQAAQDL